MNNRQRELLKQRLYDIEYDFKEANKTRAFARLCQVVKELIDELPASL